METTKGNRVGAADGSHDPRSDDRRHDLEEFDPLSGGWLPLTKQAAEILDETTTAVELVSRFDFSLQPYEDPFPAWVDSKPFEPMLRTLLVAELEDASDAAVHRTLKRDSAVARALGFDPADVPDQSTLSRAHRNRFGEYQTTLEVVGRQIRALAARRGAPIGALLWTTTALRGSRKAPRSAR